MKSEKKLSMNTVCQLRKFICGFISHKIKQVRRYVERLHFIYRFKY
jgi:hypothetical protein